jgi:hypothetical protein
MPTREELMYFCVFCDKREDKERCSFKDRYTFVSQNSCLNSTIYGINLGKVTRNSIEFDGQVYKRSEIEELISSISNFQMG